MDPRFVIAFALAALAVMPARAGFEAGDPVQAVAWLSVPDENGAKPTGLPGTIRGNLGAADLAEAENLVDDVRRQCRVD